VLWLAPERLALERMALLWRVGSGTCFKSAYQMSTVLMR